MCDEDRPYVRATKICPACDGPKPIGSLACTTCRETKFFGEMLPFIEAMEMGMRWNAERQPDRPLAQRATDSLLGACPSCASRNPVFMRFEVAGRAVAGVVQPIINYYVICRSCRIQTLPCGTKKDAARVWNTGTKVFVAETDPFGESKGTPRS